MGLVIANNVSSLVAQHNLTRTNTDLARSLERLSSGLKINRGADGPAALVISEKQRAQIAGLTQAIDNTEKAISLVQTAEGALNEISGLLVRIRSLAIDSANAGVNDDDALAANQADITNALASINRIASNTQFGTKNLLDGSSGVQATPSDSRVHFLTATPDTTSGIFALNITTAGERAEVTASTAQTTTLAADELLTINNVVISLSAGLTRTQVQDRINEFTSQTGVVAEDVAGSTRLRTVQFGADASLAVTSNLPAAADTSGFANTPTTDSGVDIAGTLGGVAFSGKGNVVTGAGATDGLVLQVDADPADAALTITGAAGSVSVIDNSLVFHIGANQYQTAEVTLRAMQTDSLGLGVAGNIFTNLTEIDVSTSAKAQDTLAIIDKAIDDVATTRGELGAFQRNTLTSTANNLRATLENTVNAESVIRDTDFAEEMAAFTKNQVLVQAGATVLSNANQTSQIVLRLLQQG